MASGPALRGPRFAASDHSLIAAILLFMVGVLSKSCSYGNCPLCKGPAGKLVPCIVLHNPPLATLHFPVLTFDGIVAVVSGAGLLLLTSLRLLPCIDLLAYPIERLA